MRTVFLIAMLGFSATASARKGSANLDMLIAGSSVVVVGTVDSVTDHYGLRIADVVVDTWLKGAPAPRVRVDVAESWICDTSTAVVGERVLLFLTPAGAFNGPYFRIVGDGTGRLPFEQHDGLLRARIEGSSFMPPASLALRTWRVDRGDWQPMVFAVDAHALVDVVRHCIAGAPGCGSSRDRVAKEIVLGIERDGTKTSARDGLAP